MAKTGVIYDRRMLSHYCPWDFNPERPARLSAILEKCQKYDLFNRCVKLEPRSATTDEISLCHSLDYIQKLSETSKMNAEELEKFASNYEDFYVCSQSYELALLSCGCALEALDAVLDGRCQNSMALIRPPGHHASFDKGCGFCTFNNVAICAKTAVEKHKLQKLLIVDFDVHAAQGTQYCIEGDDRIKLISFHRYENGEFWPHLPESNWDYSGNTINIPLNKSGLGDAEYLAAFHNIVLPIATEYNPELILISAGYDAAFGDALDGEMCLSPASYGHMTRKLQSLADAKICAILEGGYFTESLSFGVIFTLKALLGDILPPLDSLGQIDPSMVETIWNVIGKQKGTFSTLKTFFDATNCARQMQNLDPIKPAETGLYTGIRPNPIPWPTRGEYLERNEELDIEFGGKLREVMDGYENRITQNDVFEADSLEEAVSRVKNDFATRSTFKSSEEIPHQTILKYCEHLNVFQVHISQNGTLSLGIYHKSSQICKTSSDINDFSLFLHHIILPVASEIRPDLVVVQLKETEQMFQKYLLAQLSAFAISRLVVILVEANSAVAVKNSTENDMKILSDCFYQLRNYKCFSSLINFG